jgi:hypothetical protein
MRTLGCYWFDIFDIVELPGKKPVTARTKVAAESAAD